MDRSEQEGEDQSTKNISIDPNIDDEEEFNVASTNFSSHEPQMMLDDQSRDEETATELAPNREEIYETEQDSDIDMGIKANSVVGWIALALAIASFFMLPVILGGAGIVLGFIARQRDAEWIGNTAIVAGAISIIISLFIIPFV